MRMFFVEVRYPWREVREMDAEIAGKKKLWARPIWYKGPGRLYLIGTSAFQSLSAAQRAQNAMCLKLVNDSWTKSHHTYSWQRCADLLYVQKLWNAPGFKPTHK